jgi:hypothetical protein
LPAARNFLKKLSDKHQAYKQGKLSSVKQKFCIEKPKRLGIQDRIQKLKEFNQEEV